MIEEQIEQQILNNPKDKTFIDKLLARKEVDEIRRIIKKKDMSREDMLDILYLMVGTEQKLMNYSEYDRFFLSKFFVWIRSFVEVLENYFDYQDFITKEDLMSDENKLLYHQIMDKYKHATKFLVDLYLHLNRSTLSIGGAMFTEALRNKFEISYPEMKKEEKRGWLN